MTARALSLAAFLLATPATAAPEVRFLDTGGAQTAYVESGTGDPIILIHGLGADKSRFNPTVDALSKNNRVIALDLYGFGQSGAAPGPYRAEIYVDQVAALLEALEIENPTLIGNSMGGWVAMLYAERYPEATKQVVLIAPAFVYGLPNSVSADRLSAGADPRTREQMRSYLERVYADPTTDEQTIDALLRDHKTRNASGAIAPLARSIKAGDDILTPKRVAALTTETLIIQGREDGIVPLGTAEVLAETLPNAQLAVIEDAGHWPQIERAAEVNEVLLGWLAFQEQHHSM